MAKRGRCKDPSKWKPEYIEKLERLARTGPNITEGKHMWHRVMPKGHDGVKDRNPEPFCTVPLHHRHIAWAAFNRYMAKAKASGKPITQQKVASAMGNAARYCRQTITCKDRWRRASKKQMKLDLERLIEYRVRQTLDAQPPRTMSKVIPCG